jgi:hypothetical protein
MALMDDIKSLLTKGTDRTKAEEAKLAAGVQQLAQSGKRAATRALTMQERAAETGRELMLDGLELSTAGLTALARGYRNGDLSLWGMDVPLWAGGLGLVGAFGAKLYGYNGADWLRAPARGLMLEAVAFKGYKLGAEMKAASEKPKPAATASAPTPLPADPKARADFLAREKAEGRDLNADGKIGIEGRPQRPGLADQRQADPRFSPRVLAQTPQARPEPQPRRMAINPQGGRGGLAFPG